jgi:urease accessory protein
MYAATLPSEAAAAPAGDSALQRANGAVRVGFAGSSGRTRLSTLYQRTPCRALFPHVDGPVPECVFLNTAGGVAGGDNLEYGLACSDGAVAVGTTQAAERIYRSLGAASRVSTDINVSGGACLHWLPQETIVFDGARLHRRTHANLSGNSRLLAMDWLLLGRRAHGESVLDGMVHDSWRVRVDGQLIWADEFRLDAPVGAQRMRPALLDGAIAVATLIDVSAEAPGRLDQARMLLADCSGRVGATAFNGMLLCRFLAGDAQALRRDVIRFLEAYRGGAEGASVPMPRVWNC